MQPHTIKVFESHFNIKAIECFSGLSGSSKKGIQYFHSNKRIVCSITPHAAQVDHSHRLEQNGSPLVSVHHGSYCGSVCRIWCLWRASHSLVLWMRWPPTLTSVPCKAGNEVSSTTTGQADLPGRTYICCVCPAVGVDFPPQWHAMHTSALWKRRPLTQASVPCQWRWWRLDPPSSLRPHSPNMQASHDDCDHISSVTSTQKMHADIHLPRDKQVQLCERDSESSFSHRSIPIGSERGSRL